MRDKRTMYKLNKQYLLTNAVIFAIVLYIITILTTALPVSGIQDILNDKVGNNNSASDNKNTISINNQNILYESKGGNIIYQRVVNVMGNPQIEISSIEHEC